jgi:hypothetical protein
MIAPGIANALTCVGDCTFNYQFQFTDGTQFLNLSGQLTTSNTPVLNPPADPAIGYDILSITGTITGLHSVSIDVLGPSVPGFFDNILYFPSNGGSGYFDPFGIFFTDKSGVFYNIFDAGAGDTLLFGTVDDGAQTFNLVSENISPVPEPSTWAMLLIGFAGLGVLAHRHKRRAAYSLL